MATSSFISATCFTATTTKPHQSILNPAAISFHSLKPTATTKLSSATSLPTLQRRRAATIKSELNTSLVISLSTGLSLFLGRFVFFNFQRENVAKQAYQSRME